MFHNDNENGYDTKSDEDIHLEGKATKADRHKEDDSFYGRKRTILKKLHQLRTSCDCRVDLTIYRRGRTYTYEFDPDKDLTKTITSFRNAYLYKAKPEDTITYLGNSLNLLKKRQVRKPSMADL